MTMLDDALPTIYIPYPKCSHCYQDVTIEDSWAHCDTCKIEWHEVSEDAEPHFSEEEDAACGIERSPLVDEYEHKGDNVRAEYKPCILPAGHESMCLWPYDYTTTTIEPKETE